MPNAFSKYFDGKIFTNSYRIMKFVKIFPLEKNPLYGIYIRIYVCTYVCKCMYVRTCVCMYVYMYVCLYVCVWRFIHLPPHHSPSPSHPTHPLLCWPYINAHLKNCLKSPENRPSAINKVKEINELSLRTTSLMKYT